MKKILLIINVLIVLVVGVEAQKRTVKKKLSLSENIFYIKSVESGKYLNLPGSGTEAQKSNGTDVELSDFDGSNDQKFKFKVAGDDHYWILPQHCKSRLDVEGCYPDKWFCEHYKDKKGAPIQIWSFDGSSDNVGKWELVKVNTGQYMIKNKFSNKVIDATGDAHQNGCRLIIWDEHRGNNQLWEIIDAKTGQRYEN